jgi:hypothetical protein
MQGAAATADAFRSRFGGERMTYAPGFLGVLLFGRKLVPQWAHVTSPR